MPARRSGYGQPNIHTRQADEDESLFVTGTCSKNCHDVLPQDSPWCGDKKLISYLQKILSIQPHPQAGRRGAMAMLASCSKLHACAIHSGGFSFRRRVSLVPKGSRMPRLILEACSCETCGHTDCSIA